MLEKGFTVPALLHPSLPASISLLPQAPGWLLLAVFLLLGALFLLTSRLARWRRNRWRREARHLIGEVSDVDGWLGVIKRICLVHSPRANIARAISPAELLVGVPIDEASRILLCERYCLPENQLTPAQNARLSQQIAVWLGSLPHV